MSWFERISTSSELKNCSLAAALILPALAFVPGAQHTFWVPESLMAQVLTPLAALFAWLGTEKTGNEARLPKALSWLALGWGACLVLSSALALRRDLALWQLLEWGVYPLAFAAAWLHSANARGRQRVLAFILIAGALNAAYALLQASGVDRLPWNNTFAGRAGGFLGNPNFLGGHLALLIPVALAWALNTRKGSKSGPWLLLTLFFAGLLLTQTRGAWIATAISLTLMFYLLHGRFPGLLSRNRRPLLALGLAALAGAGAYFASHPLLFRRLGATVTGQDEEFSRRLFLMRKSAQLALTRPLSGAGPGNFRIQFPTVQAQGIAPDALAKSPYVLSEHGHNDFLQMAADAGWPAAFLWLALLIMLGKLLLQGLGTRSREPDRQAQAGEPLLLSGIFCGLLALQIHGLANFPFLLVPTQLTAWALAALALRLALPVGTGASPAPRPSVHPGFALALLSLIFLNSLRMGRVLAQDMAWWVGQGELGLHRPEKSSPMLARALELTRIPWLALDRQEDRLWYAYALSEAERGAPENAVNAYKACLNLDPHNAIVALRLGRALLEQEQAHGAEAVLFPVTAYAPNFIDIWEPLAASYFLQGKWEEAVKAYDWQIFFGQRIESAMANKAAAQGSLGRLNDALATLQGAERLFPGNAKLKLNLAITYLKLGMKKEAREQWLAASKIDPSDPQVGQLRGAMR